jgi:Domain of unknown function (DUF4907)
MTIRNRYSLIGITALLICFAVIFFSRQKMREGKIFLHAEAVQTVYGWGYNVLADNRIYIKQEFIPSVPGKQGFKSADDALLVGNLVIKKISNNLPPIITGRDLDSLGIVKK